jgi:TPR repeat protein
MACCRILLLVVGIFLANAGFAQPEGGDRVALVIGVQNYKHIPALRNSINDARDMASSLKGMGFEVIQLYDPTSKREIQEAVKKYFSLIDGKKTTAGLVFYSGHGVQVDGYNYLIPVGANPQIKADLDDQCLKLDFIMQALEQAGNPLNILILDACRNNPFRGFTRSIDRGLTGVEAPKGSYVVYATKPGSVASDGTGKNGLFTSKLLQYMQEPGLSIEQMFKKVARGVSEDSGDSQRPWITSDYTGDFYFTQPGMVLTMPEAKHKVTPAVSRSLTRDEAYRHGDSLRKIGKVKDAVIFYEQSAAEGHPQAQVALGEILANEEGMKDDRKSFEWNRKAAQQGLAQAQWATAVQFSLGEGVERNFDSARYWYQKSADQGFLQAQYELGMLYLAGRGGIKNENLGVNLLEKAANNNHIPSQNALGNLYLMGGETIKSNRSKAIFWFRLAAKGGDKWAKETLSSLGVRK